MNKKEKRYMFLCDQNRDCKNSSVCGLFCRHTADIEHSKNKEAGYTKFMRDASDPNLYWEWEVEIE